MIKIEHISKKFEQNTILNDINLTIKKGEIISLLGPSGTGKTTLLRCINLLEKPDKGVIQIGDIRVDCQKSTTKEFIQLRRRTAMVFQNYNLFKHKTVLENVMEGLLIVKRIPKAEAKEIALKEIEKVGLLDKLDSYAFELSGGQQQRIAIARSLALRPDVLLLDEPTSSLDPEKSLEVLKIIKKVTELGMTMVIATHEMEFARQVSTRVIFMEHGRVVEDGPPEQIFEFPKEERTREFLYKMSGDLDLVEV